MRVDSSSMNFNILIIRLCAQFLKAFKFSNNEYEIALVYFRAGYTPEDFKGKEVTYMIRKKCIGLILLRVYFNYWTKEWSARLLIERSLAIKSPSIQFQLVGTKRIQQVLTDPEILLKFVKKKEVAAKLASTFVAQYSFDVNNYQHFSLNHFKFWYNRVVFLLLFPSD